MAAWIQVALLLVASDPSDALHGVDVSILTNESAWQCAKEKASIDWAVVRAWHSYGASDQNAKPTLKGAKAAGVPKLDVYMFPCFGRNLTAHAQVKGLIDGLGGVDFDTMWFDIEFNPSKDCGWGTNQTANCEYLGDLINSAAGTGTASGVYSSHLEWHSVMGDNCTTAASLPLWYAHFDKNASCADYERLPFGGWTTPFAKQYADKSDPASSACGVSGDLDVQC
jgi:hypothetical protein